MGVKLVVLRPSATSLTALRTAMARHCVDEEGCESITVGSRLDRELTLAISGTAWRYSVVMLSYNIE